MRLPAYGQELLNARRMGARPAQPVVVTDCWNVARMYKDSDIFALVCHPANAPYDFTLLYALDVMVMVGSDDCLGLVERIAQAKPERLSVSLREETVKIAMRVVAQFFDRGEDKRGWQAKRAVLELNAFEWA